MKINVLSFLSIPLAFLLLTGCGNGENQEEEFQESAEEQANVIFAKEFIMFTSEGRYERATEYLDESMIEKFPPPELENVWSSIEEEFGPFISQDYDLIKKTDNQDVVTINGEFEKGNVTFEITINQNEKITDFTYEK